MSSASSSTQPAWDPDSPSQTLPLEIVLLLGGTSAEREVSLRSGQNASEALRSRGHRVTCIDPAEHPADALPLPPCDVVFLALHGAFGEDGTVQSLLEHAGLPYTGSGPEASRLAFDKLLAKRCLNAAGVRTPPAIEFTPTTDPDELTQQAHSLGFPVYVKPAAQGSSLGVTPVHTAEDLPAALQEALRYDSRGLIEQGIQGSEWTIGLFDELTFPVIVIEPIRRFYDFNAKYHDPHTRFRVAPEIPSAIQQELTQTARNTYQAFRAEGVARVDLMLDRHGQAWVLELNTLPGLTEQSTVPQAATYLGWSLGELCERMCLAAIQRHNPTS